MIGFRDQDAMRRPIYSGTSHKLGYLVSGPDGDWWTDINGRKIGRIKKFRRPQMKEVHDQHLNGNTYITWTEINDNC